MVYCTLGQNIKKKSHWPPIAAVTADGPAVLLADSPRRDGGFPLWGKPPAFRLRQQARSLNPARDRKDGNKCPRT